MSVAGKYVYPIRPWKRVKCDATFLSASYHKAFGRWHKGIDLNLFTGGDTDLGYPVQSSFPGKVVYANPRVGSWGGIVMVRSSPVAVQDAADMTGIPMDVLDVQYAHLMHVTVQAGDVLRAGDHVGSIGKGTHNQYLAHLHLEMRRTVREANEPQGKDDTAFALAKHHYLDPLAIYAALRPTDYAQS